MRRAVTLLALAGCAQAAATPDTNAAAARVLEGRELAVDQLQAGGDVGRCENRTWRQRYTVDTRNGLDWKHDSNQSHACAFER